MKVGQTITVERLESGLYKVITWEGVELIGSAASTTIAIATLVFKEEAHNE